MLSIIKLNFFGHNNETKGELEAENCCVSTRRVRRTFFAFPLLLSVLFVPGSIKEDQRQWNIIRVCQCGSILFSSFYSNPLSSQKVKRSGRLFDNKLKERQEAKREPAMMKKKLFHVAFFVPMTLLVIGVEVPFDDTKCLLTFIGFIAHRAWTAD